MIVDSSATIGAPSIMAAVTAGDIVTAGAFVQPCAHRVSDRSGGGGRRRRAAAPPSAAAARKFMTAQTNAFTNRARFENAFRAVDVEKRLAAAMATSAPPAQLSPLPGTDLSREINYGRIARLFTDETTAELYERQAAMMERVCRHNADGYKLKHLAEVQAIMELAAARVEAGHELFTERLVAMIRLFGKPCVAVESNEHFRSGPALEGMVGALSCFLLLKAHPTVNVAAAEVLREFTRGVDPAGHGAAPDDLRTTMAAFHQGVLVRAGVLPAIVGALQVRARARGAVYHVVVHIYIMYGCAFPCARVLMRAGGGWVGGCSAAQVEVNELLGFDVNKDGVIDASELHAYATAR